MGDQKDYFDCYTCYGSGAYMDRDHQDVQCKVNCGTCDGTGKVIKLTKGKKPVEQGPPHLITEKGYYQDPVQFFGGMTFLLTGLLIGTIFGMLIS